MRDALACDVCIPFKNSSMVAQYVIDSLSVVEYGSGSYMSLTVYIASLRVDAHSVSARLLLNM